MSYPKAKIRISEVQLVCRKCESVIPVPDPDDPDDSDVNEWNEVQYPPTNTCTCEICGKKHSVPDVGMFIGKTMGVRK